MVAEGTVLAGRYEIGRLLGRGGMAEVYLGTDRVLERPVAVKLLGSWLADDGAFVERFRREALDAARISHPNVVGVYDAGSEDGLHFIVMEHVPGESLADALARDGPLDPDRAVAIARSVARALGVAHRNGIVHRDVKPANVMLAADGRVRLLDLGIARSLGSADLTRTTAVLGSPNYLSPEQARGERVDARSDLYSLGCVLFEMLTGRPPFEAETPVAVAYRHVHDEPPRPSSIVPTVPAWLDDVTLRAMAKDPADRYPTAESLEAALAEAPAGVGPATTVPIPAVPTTPIAPVPGAQAPAVEPTTPLPAADRATPVARRRDRARRRWRWPLAAAAVALAAAGGIAVALLSDTGPVRGRSAGPTASPSPSPPPSPSPSPSPSPAESPPPPPASPVDAALAPLLAVVDEGVAEGRISDGAAGEIHERIDASLQSFAEGHTEDAIVKLDQLESRIDELVEQGEVDRSQENRLDRALEDLALAMFAGQPPGDGGDGGDGGEGGVNGGEGGGD
jgi:eukaryotic-like serine/threonine-protein kinase